MILLNLMKKTVVLIVLLPFLASNVKGNTSSDVDSFIVDYDKEETVKKSMLLTSGSMSLGFMPKSNSSADGKINEVPTLAVSRRFETGISSEKSLKESLDVSGDKRAILPKVPDTVNLRNNTNNTNNTKASVDPLKPEILKGLKPIKQLKVNFSTEGKRDAKPNVITDAGITGFLSKNPKFSIGDVGNQKEEETVDQNESEEKLSKKLNKGQENSTDINNNSVIATPGSNMKSEILSSDNKAQPSNHIKSKLHLVNPAAFLMPPNEPFLVDHEKQENAVKKEDIESHHEPECSEDKKCPKNKYCRHFHCYEGHRKHHECHEDDQCIDGMFCIYGRCDDKAKGSPGTICLKDGDCGDGCCVIEPTITEEHGICKTKLEEFHQCAPVLFRKVWLGDEKPKCGPCADGLECLERGLLSSHLVCMKKK